MTKKQLALEVIERLKKEYPLASVHCAASRTLTSSFHAAS